jgi:hypothetical protein
MFHILDHQLPAGDGLRLAEYFLYVCPVETTFIATLESRVLVPTRMSHFSAANGSHAETDHYSTLTH